MLHFRVMATGRLLGLFATVVRAGSLGAQAATKPLPLKYVGPATVPAITAGDLMTRLYKYSDDSMMGRDVGTLYHLKAVAYVEREVRRLGLKPGGTDGYYQDFPIWQTSIDPTSTLIAGDAVFPIGNRFIAIGDATAKHFASVPVVFGGIVTDTLTSLDSAAVAGKLLLLESGPRLSAEAQQAVTKSEAYKAFRRALAGAAGTLQLQGDSLSPPLVKFYTSPSPTMTALVTEGPQRAPILLITTPVVEAIFGGPVSGLSRGQVGKTVTTDLRYTRTPGLPGRNVIAILPGSDPKLKGEYVAIGAHSDHIGFSSGGFAREHDSLRIYNAIGRPAGAEGGRNLATTPITSEEWAKTNADIADLRTVYPPRPDSIFNGADDDGTGTVSVLELAEAFAKGSVKPKRSLLFVWHAGEEKGMWGSGYFMDNPTVPRDSIVAQLNIDMVGRGAATDVTGQKKEGGVLHGGDHYVQLVGSRRLSTELGDLVETVNTEKKHGFVFDYNIDADGHPQDIYCRSDHWSYAKWGVPVVFFTTGGHADYHQVTDEPQYIRYDRMAALDRLIFDVAVGVANLDHRVVVDKPKPNPAPATSCKQ
jgi:Peptidase family M28